MTTAQPCAASDQLIDEITSALMESAALTKLVDVAHQLRGRPDLLRAHLRFVLAHPGRLSKVADRSYWHVNGFAKIRLLVRDEFCVRLHVWPAGFNRLGDTEPHSHRWDFASWVAVGDGLAETYWVETDESHRLATTHFEYRYGRDSGAAFLRARRIVQLRPEWWWSRIGGTVYGCPNEVVHTVVPIGDDLLATVVFQGPTRADSTTVYRQAGKLCTTAQRPITVTELVELLGLVDTAVAAGGSHNPSSGGGQAVPW